MKLTEPQKEISNHPARFRVAACGRRFGKSYLAINELAKFARHPHRKCLFISPSYRMGKQIIWDDLKSMLRQNLLESKFLSAHNKLTQWTLKDYQHRLHFTN